MENSFADRLLQWYFFHRRTLPWREDPTPYHVLLSETMLQQTRVDTVIPYYERFLSSFPTIGDLASAEEKDVLRLWQGLGYYSRARNLYKLAQIVQRDYSGKIPAKMEDLRSLPGIGAYCASAILAIAFGKDFVAVDGNLSRVYCRLERVALPPNEKSVRRGCDAYFSAKIEDPSSFNQALMDLGELICLPSGSPHCALCPIAEFCKAHKDGNPLDYPAKAKKPVAKIERLAVLLSVRGGMIGVRSRPSEGLLASMDEFPCVYDAHSAEDVCRYFGVKKVKPIGRAKHRFSHIVWEMDVFFTQEKLPDVRYVPLVEIKEKASLPTAFAKLLQFV